MMKTESRFSVQFEDGTIKSGLTFEESDQVMKESEGTDNRWTRVYVDRSN